MNKALLSVAALVCSMATASAADLVAPIDGEAAPVPGPPPQVYAAPPVYAAPVYAAPVYTAPQVYVVPAPVYAAPVVTAPVVTAPVVTPHVVSHPIYAYAPGYWGHGWHGWRGHWH
jgi:ribonuclease E